MDMFGYILFSFLDSCPDFILFRHKRPRVGSRRGTAQGAALLTKWGETAIIKAERALLLAVGSTRFAQIDYADRLAPPRRSVCFYRTERAPLLAVGFPYQLIIIMLTVQLPLGGQHAFMDSARARMTTHTKNLQGNLSTPASPPFHMEFARG